MSKLVMAHNSPNLTIGGIYKGLGPIEEKREFLQDQPYRVVKKVTALDYIESCVSLGISRESMDSLIQKAGSTKFYYEIQTD